MDFFTTKKEPRPQYKLTPKKDITPYELAQILIYANQWVGCKEIEQQKDPKVFRHLTKIK